MAWMGMRRAGSSWPELHGPIAMHGKRSCGRHLLQDGAALDLWDLWVECGPPKLRLSENGSEMLEFAGQEAYGIRHGVEQGQGTGLRGCG